MQTDTISLPEWLVVGADVVEFTPSRHGSSQGGTILRSKVERILKRDVVLENGDRFNINRLQRDNGTWVMDTVLISPDDPRVDAARRANAISNRWSAVENAWDKVRRSKSDTDCAQLVAAVESYRRALADRP